MTTLSDWEEVSNVLQHIEQPWSEPVHGQQNQL